MLAGLDIVHGILIVLVIGLGVIVAKLRARTDEPLREEIEALKGELRVLKGKPLEKEYRLEQFELLWFPVVTYEPAEKRILKVAAGLPYCPACTAIMKAVDGKEWKCSRCDRRCPASVTDLTVMDTLENKVREYFIARHSEYAPAG